MTSVFDLPPNTTARLRGDREIGEMGDLCTVSANEMQRNEVQR